jgi:glycosyltransferase involved in cell wall biosynthesis
LRQWDKVASQRPDEMISISEQVKKRVQKYYDRETDVIYPPVDTKKFTKLPSYQDPTLLRDYYLIVSRLVPYKNIELAIRACNDLGRELVIVGTGSAERELKKIAGPTVHFMGFLSDQQVVAYMSRCRAYIQCNEEDFGIAMVEAQAAGRPVIAYNRGGATDIVRERTGVLYNELTVHALSGAIIASEKTRFISADCQRNAARFDKVKWLRTMKERIMKSCQTKKN